MARRRRVRSGVRLRGQLADTFFRQVFLGEGCVPLTDQLIDELVSKGWDHAELMAWRAEGAVYSKPRQSVLSVTRRK